MVPPHPTPASPADGATRAAPAPLCVRTGDRLDGVTNLLRESGIDRAVVVDADGYPTGVIVQLGGAPRPPVGLGQPPPLRVVQRPLSPYAATGAGEASSMEMSVVCPVCRSELPWDTRFCPRDGVDLRGVGQPARTPDALVGRVLGPYRLLARIGEGGMGVVYRAEHTVIVSLAAVKVMLPCFAGNADVLARFFQEARAVNRVRHENVVHVSDYGHCEDGTPYYVMELLDGHSLGQLLGAEGRLRVRRAVNIARQIALGLAAAHDAGVVHRDLKPSNVMLVRVGAERDFVKLLDFGIAKLLVPDGPDAAAPVTATGARLGTPYYMSPEQILGQRVDHRTDVYTFGVLLYRMLTGNLPFGGTPEECMRDHLTVTAPPLRAPGIDFPAGLQDLVAHCLCKPRDGRPSSFAEVVEVLETVAADCDDRTIPLDDEWTGLGAVPEWSPAPPPPLPVPSPAPGAVFAPLARAHPGPAPAPPASPVVSYAAPPWPATHAPATPAPAPTPSPVEVPSSRRAPGSRAGRRERLALGLACGAAVLLVACVTLAVLALGSGRASAPTAAGDPPPAAAGGAPEPVAPEALECAR
jgi:serine/threonine protein kinase